MPAGDEPGVTFERSDYGNARHLEWLSNGTLKYDPRYGHWMHWENGRWHHDTSWRARFLAVQSSVSRFSRVVGLEDEQRVAEQKWAIRSQSASAIRGMLDIAESFPSMTASDWDSDPHVLGVGNGVVGLNTGVFRKQVQADAVLQKTTVEFDPDAQCPRWERFIREVVPPEYVDFLQIAVGYSLTGEISEQCFFYLVGEGGNGKSLFIRVVEKLLGEYAATASFNTFLKHRDSQPSNDLAELVGKRFVSASEPSRGATWDDARIKSVTGGDEITCRFLYQKHFSYRPQMKLWVAANHMITSTDYSDGFWRRVRVIPFPNRFSPRAEPNLLETLHGEMSGILNWALEGASKWIKLGLEWPESMTEQVSEYKETQISESWGALPAFMSERTKPCDDGGLPALQLYKAYRGWAVEAGLTEKDMLTNTGFGRQLTAMKVKKVRRAAGMLYALDLLPHEEARIRTDAPNAG